MNIRQYNTVQYQTRCLYGFIQPYQDLQCTAPENVLCYLQWNWWM